MDGLKMLYPEPAAPSGGATEGDDDDGEVALRLHRALHARPARRRGRAEAAGGAEEDDDGEEEEEEEEDGEDEEEKGVEGRRGILPS